MRTDYAERDVPAIEGIKCIGDTLIISIGT